METTIFQQHFLKIYSISYRYRNRKSRVWPSSVSIHGCKFSFNGFSGVVLAFDGGQEYSRKEGLRRVDLELERGNEREAVSLVLSLQGKPGGLRGFGAANQVPQRLYTLEELKLNKVDTTCLLSPVDRTLGSVRKNLQLAAIVGGIAAWNILGLKQLQFLSIVLALLALGTIDLVVYGGGGEALLVDTMGRLVSQKYRNRVAQHESGHFLIAYLLGVLPKGYALSSFEAFKKEGSLNVQAGTAFVDFQFLEEVKSGKLSSGRRRKVAIQSMDGEAYAIIRVRAHGDFARTGTQAKCTLNKYSCIALAGVAIEYLLFGSAEGGLADIQQLDNLMKILNFTQKQADSQVRWSLLNAVTLLRRHKQVQSKLAEAMSFGMSVGECIDTIENELMNALDI